MWCYVSAECVFSWTAKQVRAAPCTRACIALRDDRHTRTARNSLTEVGGQWVRNKFNKIFRHKLTPLNTLKMSEERLLMTIITLHYLFSVIVWIRRWLAPSEKYLGPKQSPPNSHNDLKKDGAQLLRGGGGIHIWKWRGCADKTPKVGVFRWQTKGVFRWGQKKNRGSFGEDYKKEVGLSVKPSVFRKKRGSFSEALNLSAKCMFLFLVHIKRVVFFWWKWGYSVRAFISKKWGCSVRAFYFLKWGHSRGSLSERAFWKWGH